MLYSCTHMATVGVKGFSNVDLSCLSPTSTLNVHSAEGAAVVVTLFSHNIARWWWVIVSSFDLSGDTLVSNSP